MRSTWPVVAGITLLLTVGILAWFAVPRSVAQENPAAEHKEGVTMTDEAKAKHWKVLTPEEERVIVGKGTEMPFTGEYTDLTASGVYECRRCGAMLYKSEDKFHSGCGWPSFDDEIPGAVKRQTDADGARTEILCANCGGHLGHVFEGEHLTDKDVRHCVNSVSMTFVPEDQVQYGRVYFAAGCFWGVEEMLKCQPGVVDTTVGYMGGHTDNPTYKDVCTHTTGHAETVEVLYDPVRLPFEDLAKAFFELHDPTQVNGQGPDLGDQYRSEIFYTTDEQKAVAEKLIAELEGRGMKIATRVTPAGKFWPGEDYHQDYYEKKGMSGSCHVRKKLW